jgi:glutathione S-transferase
VLAESKVIVAYLSEVQPSLLARPTSKPAPPPPRRALGALLIDLFERELSPCLHSILNAADDDALYAAAHALLRGLGSVDGFLRVHIAPGERFEAAETIIAPDLPPAADSD